MCRQLPLRVTAAVLYTACKSEVRTSNPRLFINLFLNQTDGCAYHEHDNDEEGQLCKLKHLTKREALQERYGVKLSPYLHPWPPRLTNDRDLGIQRTN